MTKQQCHKLIGTVYDKLFSSLSNIPFVTKLALDWFVTNFVTNILFSSLCHGSI